MFGRPAILSVQAVALDMFLAMGLDMVALMHSGADHWNMLVEWSAIRDHMLGLHQQYLEMLASGDGVEEA